MPMQITTNRREPLPQRRAAEAFELQHGGKAVTFHVTLGYYPDGRVGEVFISGTKSGTEVEANVRDGAVLVSIALQHHVPLDVMRNAITREANGAASTIIGVVLDLMREEGQP